MSSRARYRQRHRERSRPTLVPVVGVLMLVIGVLDLVDSALILGSAIVFGWLITGIIGVFTFACGVALLERADWAYTVSKNMAILNIFVGFIEMIGAINYHYAIRGWVGVGEAVGVATLIFSLVSVYILFRRDVRHYYEGFV